MKRSRRFLPLAALLLLPLLTSCGDLIYQDAAPEAQPVLLTLDQALQSEPLLQAELQVAFGTVDGVHVRLVDRNDGAVVVDELFSAAPSDGEIRIQVEAELPEQSESFQLAVELRNGANPLFRGGTVLTLRPGARVQPEIDLEPVVAGLEITPAAPGPLRSLGETVDLAAQLIFATGAPLAQVDPLWEALDPDVVSVASNGVATAEGPGIGRIRASLGGFSDQVEVEVALEPASVEVEPAEAELSPGQTLQLTAVVRDAGGSEISVPVEWSSSDASVATVSDEGLVEARDLGSAVIQATSGDQSGEAQIEVVARAPTAETVGATNITTRSATIRGRVNPRGFVTQVWFEWGTDPSLEDPRVTEPSPLTASASATLVGHNLADLEPGTRYYFRVLASNEVGEAQGEIRSFETAQPVVAQIRVEPAELELGILETAQLTAVVLDDAGGELDVEIEWSSSDEAVVSVTAQGEVQGQVEGSATIEARVGDVVGQAQVVVVASAPLVETVEAADIATNSARIRGSVNPAGSETMAWFEVSPNAELVEALTTEPISLEPSTDDEPVEYELMNLASATTYYFRVVAENEVGTSTGEVLSFTTAPPVPTAFDVQIIEGEGDTWVQASWSYDVESFPDATFEVEVRRIAPEVGPWELAAETQALFAEIEEDLTAGITYEFRVRACIPEVCSDWSDTVEVTPSGFAPFVQNRPNIDHDGTEAVLRAWVSDGGEETEFYFEWGDNNDFVDWNTTPTQTTTRAGFSTFGPEIGQMDGPALQQGDGPADEQVHRVEAFLTDLTPGQEYFFMAIAQNPHGSDEGSQVHSFVAGEVPAPIQDLSLSQLSYAVFVSWNWPAENGSPDFYEVERQDGIEGQWEHLTDEGPTFYDDLDVEAGVRYGYRVRACFVDGGCSELSDPEFIDFTGDSAESLAPAAFRSSSPDLDGSRAPPIPLRPARGWR